MAQTLYYLFALFLLIASAIQILWGVLALREGYPKKPFRHFHSGWEFWLGGMLISTGLMFSSLIVLTLSVSDPVIDEWFISFFVVGLLLALFSSFAGYCWFTGKFDADIPHSRARHVERNN